MGPILRYMNRKFRGKKFRPGHLSHEGSELSEKADQVTIPRDLQRYGKVRGTKSERCPGSRGGVVIGMKTLPEEWHREWQD